MSVHKIHSIQLLLSFIFLLNHISLKCVSIKCDIRLYSNGCPSYATCNEVVGICYCKPEYSTSFLRYRPCLKYKQLGQRCFHSSQCSEISNAVCYDKNLDEPDRIPIFQEFFRRRFTQNDDYEDRSDRYAKRKCRVGYRMSANRCEKMKLNEVICQNSADCLHHDKNTYCDRDTKECSCNYLYTYNPDTDRCAVNITRPEIESNQSKPYLRSLAIITIIIFLHLIFIKCALMYVCRKKIRNRPPLNVNQRNNERRLRRNETLLPYAPFSPIFVSVIEPELNIESQDGRNLLNVAGNDLNEYYSLTMISPPPYDMVSMNQQLPTYEQAIASAKIQV